MSDSSFSTHTDGTTPSGWTPTLTSCIMNAAEMPSNVLSVLPNVRQMAINPHAQNNSRFVSVLSDNFPSNPTDMFVAHGIVGSPTPFVIGNVDNPNSGPCWSGFGLPCRPIPPTILGASMGNMGITTSPMCQYVFPNSPSWFFDPRMPISTSPLEVTTAPSAGDSAAVNSPASHNENSVMNSKSKQKESEESPEEQGTVKKVKKRIVKKVKKCKSENQLRKLRKVYTAPKALRKKCVRDTSDIFKQVGKSQKPSTAKVKPCTAISPCEVDSSNHDSTVSSEFVEPIPEKKTSKTSKKKQRKLINGDGSSESCVPVCDKSFGDTIYNREQTYEDSEPIGVYKKGRKEKGKKKKRKQSDIKERTESSELLTSSDHGDGANPIHSNSSNTDNTIHSPNFQTLSTNLEHSKGSKETVDAFMENVVSQYRKSRKNKYGIRPVEDSSADSQATDSPPPTDLPFSLPRRGTKRDLEGVPTSGNVFGCVGNRTLTNEVHAEEERQKSSELIRSLPTKNAECPSFTQISPSQSFRVCGPRLESIAEEVSPQHPYKPCPFKKTRSTKRRVSKICVCRSDKEVVATLNGHVREIPIRICCLSDTFDIVKKEIVLDSDVFPNLSPRSKREINLSGISNKEEESPEENVKKKNPVKCCTSKNSPVKKRDIFKQCAVRSERRTSAIPGLPKPPSNAQTSKEKEKFNTSSIENSAKTRNVLGRFSRPTSSFTSITCNYFPIQMERESNEKLNSPASQSKSDHGFPIPKKVNPYRDKMITAANFDKIKKFRRRITVNDHYNQDESSVSQQIHGYSSLTDKSNRITRPRPDAVFCKTNESLFSDLTPIKKSSTGNINCRKKVVNRFYVERKSSNTSGESEVVTLKDQVNPKVVNTMCVPLVPRKWHESEMDMLIEPQKHLCNEIDKKETTLTNTIATAKYSPKEEKSYEDKLRMVRESISEIVYEHILKINDNARKLSTKPVSLDLSKSCFHSLESNDKQEGDAHNSFGFEFLENITLPLSGSSESNKSKNIWNFYDREDGERYIKEKLLCPNQQTDTTDFPKVKSQKCDSERQREREKRNFCRLFLHEFAKESVNDSKKFHDKANKLPLISSVKRVSQHSGDPKSDSLSNQKRQTTAFPRYISHRSPDRLPTIDIQPVNRKRILHAPRSSSQDINSNDKPRKIPSRERNTFLERRGSTEYETYSPREKYNHLSIQETFRQISPQSRRSCQFNHPYRSRFDKNSQGKNGNSESQGKIFAIGKGTFGHYTPRDTINNDSSHPIKHYSEDSRIAFRSLFGNTGKTKYGRNNRMPHDNYVPKRTQKFTSAKLVGENRVREEYNNSRNGNAKRSNRSAILYYSKNLQKYSKESFYKDVRDFQRWNSFPNIPTYCKHRKPVMRQMNRSVSVSSSSTVLSVGKTPFEPSPRMAKYKCRLRLPQNEVSKNLTNKSQVNTERTAQKQNKLTSQLVEAKSDKMNEPELQSSVQKTSNLQCTHSQQNNDCNTCKKSVSKIENQDCIPPKINNPQCASPASQQNRCTSNNIQHSVGNNNTQQEAMPETFPPQRDTNKANNQDVESNQSQSLNCENNDCDPLTQINRSRDSDKKDNKDILGNVFSGSESVKMKECNISNVQGTSTFMRGEERSNSECTQEHSPSLDNVSRVSFSLNRGGTSSDIPECPRKMFDSISSLGECSLLLSPGNPYMKNIANTKMDNRRCPLSSYQYADRFSLGEVDVSSLSSYGPKNVNEGGDENSYITGQYAEKSSLGGTDLSSSSPYFQIFSKNKRDSSSDNPEPSICINRYNTSLGETSPIPLVSNIRKYGSPDGHCNKSSNKEFSYPREQIKDLQSTSNAYFPIDSRRAPNISSSINPEYIKIHPPPLPRNNIPNDILAAEYKEKVLSNANCKCNISNDYSRSAECNCGNPCTMLHFAHTQRNDDHPPTAKLELSNNKFSHEVVSRDLPLKLNDPINDVESETKKLNQFNPFINRSKIQGTDSCESPSLFPFPKKKSNENSPYVYTDSRGGTLRITTPKKNSEPCINPLSYQPEQKNRTLSCAANMRSCRNPYNLCEESVMRPAMKPVSSSSASTILSGTCVTFEVTAEKDLFQLSRASPCPKIQPPVVQEKISQPKFWNKEYVCNQYAARYKVPLSKRMPLHDTDCSQTCNNSNKQIELFSGACNSSSSSALNNRHKNIVSKPLTSKYAENSGKEFKTVGIEPHEKTDTSSILNNAREATEKILQVTKDDANQSDNFSGYLCTALSRAIYNAMCRSDTYPVWKSALDTLSPVSLEITPVDKQFEPSETNEVTNSNSEKENICQKKRHRHRSYSHSKRRGKSHKHRSSRSSRHRYSSHRKRKNVSSDTSSASSSSESSDNSSEERMHPDSDSKRNNSEGKNKVRDSNTWKDFKNSFLKVTEVRRKTIQSMPGVRSKVVKDLNDSKALSKKDVSSESHDLRGSSLTYNNKSYRDDANRPDTFQHIPKISILCETKENASKHIDISSRPNSLLSTRRDNISAARSSLQQLFQRRSQLTQLPLTSPGKSIRLSCSPIVQVNKLPEDMNTNESISNESLPELSINKDSEQLRSSGSWKIHDPPVNVKSKMRGLDLYSSFSKENNSAISSNLNKVLQKSSAAIVENEVSALIHNILFDNVEKMKQINSNNMSKTCSAQSSPTDSLLLQVEEFKKAQESNKCMRNENTEPKSNSKKPQVSDWNFATANVTSDADIFSSQCSTNPSVGRGSKNKNQKCSVYQLLQ